MALQDKANSSLYHFLDASHTPDPYYTDQYTSQHKGKGTALVIDNGSYQCRVGWSDESQPQLVFRNAIARTRGKKGEPDCICIGNDIANMEAVRSSLRNQFDKNIVSNFSYQEQIFDYSFSHLGLTGERSVNHPVLVTEPVCNPAYCRGHMSELLFEGYGVPSVVYGIDALFSAYCNLGNHEDCIVVSAGHQAAHVLPVLGGRLDIGHCKRVNVGGLHVVSYLHHLLQLKYPALQAHTTLTRAQEILNTHGFLALDYPAEMREWETGSHNKLCRILQMPYNQATVVGSVDEAAKEVRDKQRKQRARDQLLRVNQKKKEEKIADYQNKLDDLSLLLEAQSTVDSEEYQMMLEESGFNTGDELQTVVTQTRAALEMEQIKLSNLERSLAGETAEVEEEEKMSEEFLLSLRERRKELLEQRRLRLIRKQELGKRRSAASQHRMRIISLLGAEESLQTKKKTKHNNKEDTFGMDDDDWNVYRTISKDADGSSDEREENELSDICKVLEKHDPDFLRPHSQSQTRSADIATYYQMVVGVERLRSPEVIFQPSMLGIDQSGLSDTLEYVLQYFPPDVQQSLVQNVFVTGGSSQTANFDARIETDLRAIRPFRSEFHVTSARDKELDAWRGACSWVNDLENKQYFISKSDYLEKGSEFIREHFASNVSVSLGDSSLH